VGEDWNNFMQSKPVRIALNLMCASFCVFYAIDAIRELIGEPSETAVLLVQQIGPGAYTAITVARAVVCAVTGIVFGRMALKAVQEQE
jgi:hypothetical protein